MKKHNIFLIILVLFFISCNIEIGDDPENWEEAESLHEIYKSEFLIGNIIRNTNCFNNKTRSGILKHHFNTVTAENDMKPSLMAPSSKPTTNTWNYRFSSADNIVNAANNAGMKVVGHTLIWHSQTPAWLTDGNKETVLANLEKYVTEVVTHFKGRLIEWDVVNEAFRDGLQNVTASTDWKTCLRVDDSGWNKTIGPEYIEKAFLAARLADPDVKLLYNDYNLNNANKAQAVFNMVKDINTRHPNVNGRQLIDGIGMQSHHHINTSPQTVENSINLFASLNVDIAITELDIIAAGRLLNAQNPPPWNEAAALRQAQQYAAMLNIFKKNSSKISRVTFWGFDDGTHWRTLDNSGAYASLMDKDYNLKPAFYAVLNPNRY